MSRRINSSLEIMYLLYKFGIMRPLYVYDIYKEQSLSDYYTRKILRCSADYLKKT